MDVMVLVTIQLRECSHVQKNGDTSDLPCLSICVNSHGTAIGSHFHRNATQFPNTGHQRDLGRFQYSNGRLGRLFLFYQRFLRERLPRAVRKTNDKAQDHAAQIQNHRELVALLEKFSEVCNSFAHSGMFPAVADPAIKKEDKERIPGTWNFYRNIPPNTSDIWQESCYLRFLALLHESEIDFDRLAPKSTPKFNYRP